MNLVSCVAEFLENERGKGFCDICVTEWVQVNARIDAKLSDINRAAWTLAESLDFGRLLGKCSLCKQVKVTTRVR